MASLASSLLCSIGSAFFNGTFSSPYKKVSHLNLHPMVFQLYSSIGVFLSSWLVVPFLPFNDSITDDEAGQKFAFSSLGLVAGVLFVLANFCSLRAISLLGVALGQGIWGGAAILVSYIWGAVIFGETPDVIALSVGGICALIVGVVCIAQCETLGAKVGHHLTCGDPERSRLVSSAGIPIDKVYSIDRNTSAERVEEGNVNEAATAKRSEQYIEGLVWACFVGLFGGSILVPLHYTPKDQAGLVFIPSFGIGALAGSSLAYTFQYLFSAEENRPVHSKIAFGPGLLSGALWNCGNLLSLISISNLGYNVAYPILQCAVFVSGLWGILVWKEITDVSTVIVFFSGGFILICGAIMLALGQ